VKHTLTLLTALLLAPLAALHAAAPQRPNVLFLLADDLGYADIGVNGCADFATPNIDSIAKNGVRFTSGYVTAPVCSPSRAGLMTGRWQTRFGHEFNHPMADRSPVGLPLTEKLAAQWFKDAGYATGHVGKWHLGNPKMPEFAPKARGFDESVWFGGQRKLPPLQFFRHEQQGKADDRYVDEAMAREASAFVEKHRGVPWFLYCAFLTPHQPLDTPPGAEEPFANIADKERRKCAATVSILDGAVGRILKTLRETGQEERTFIVLLSDNGAPPKNGSRNTPLRGGKGSTWEGGLREPFVMQWKGGLPAGRVVDAPVASLDLLPTALAAAGVTPAGAKFDGVNLLPFLTGRTTEPPHAALFWRYGEQFAVRAGDWKLARSLDSAASPPTLKTGLFNLRTDVSEQHDLSATEPAKAKELQSLWDQWNAGNMKALWGGEGGKAQGSQAPNPAAKQATLASDFPGGNIVLEKTEGDNVFVHQDLRDTKGDWFYWYFAVRGAAGRELTFHFTQSRAIGPLGPGISRDQGATWTWLGKRDSPNSFKFRFGAEENEVRFSFGMPYQHADLLRWLDRHNGSAHLKTEVLGRTKRGTPVESLRLGKLSGEPDFKVLVTARHHACEMMASYVAEGFMDAFLDGSETAKWLREHVQCAVLPLVDKDGVEAGDQGKNRQPHDHKADYRGESIYPEVAALREFVTKWAGGKPAVTLDLHNPAINHDAIYTHALRGTTGKTPAEIAALLAKSGALRFLRTVEKVQTGTLKFRVKDSLDFAARIRGGRPEAGDDERRQNAAAPVSIGFEIPYALVGEVPVTPETARAFGGDIALALVTYLKSIL
jgi:arylsulfatase A-like enzyme